MADGLRRPETSVSVLLAWKARNKVHVRILNGRIAGDAVVQLGIETAIPAVPLCEIERATVICLGLVAERSDV